MFNHKKEQIKNLKNENLQLNAKIDYLKNENKYLTGQYYKMNDYCNQLQDILMYLKKESEVKDNGKEN